MIKRSTPTRIELRGDIRAVMIAMAQECPAVRSKLILLSDRYADNFRFEVDGKVYEITSSENQVLLRRPGTYSVPLQVAVVKSEYVRIRDLGRAARRAAIQKDIQEILQ